MERDCLIAHGATHLLTERMMRVSGQGILALGKKKSKRKQLKDPLELDAYRMLLCSLCGRAMCHDGVTCSNCKQTDGVKPVMVPYSFGQGLPGTCATPGVKLLLQEMTCCGIDWRLSLE